jgi:hypothetical protein
VQYPPFPSTVVVSFPLEARPAAGTLVVAG